MMDRNPDGTALREARRHQKFGANSPFCLICGQPALKIVTAALAEARGIPRGVIADHHVVGCRRESSLTAPLCLSCHWLVTTNLLRESISMRAEQDSNQFVASCLIALAVFLEMLCPSLRAWASRLLGPPK
jgi:hypothetical protein